MPFVSFARAEAVLRSALKREIRSHGTDRAAEHDLEIDAGDTVDLALDARGAVGEDVEAQLARRAGKGVGTLEREDLVVGRDRIGVDGDEIDLVVFCLLEVEDEVARAGRAIRDCMPAPSASLSLPPRRRRCRCRRPRR